MKYKSELIKEIVDSRGHEKSSIHYESECIEPWIEETKGAYPKLCDYESEWLNYINDEPIGEFPYITLTDVTEATVDNVVPFAYQSAILKGSTKYRDIDTGEILEAFEEGRNLELVSVKTPVLMTTGKNLFDYQDFKNTVLSGDTTTKYPINLKPNTTYTFSDKTGLWNGGNGYFVELSLKDENDVEITKIIDCNAADRKTFTFTTSNSSKYYLFIYRNNMDKMDKVSSDFQIEEGSVATEYEPYKSNILSTSEDVTLRGIGDVRDTLDCLTGKVTERISEVVLDGSENWVKPSTQPTNTSRFLLVGFPNNENAKILSNIRVKNNTLEDAIGIWCDTNTVLNVDTSIDTVESLKVFLSENPIKLQYSLATESIKTVDLTVVNQDGESMSKIKPIEGTMHLTTSSDTIPPLFSGEIPVEAITQNLTSFIKEE